MGERVGVAAWVVEGSVADPRGRLAETGKDKDVTQVSSQWCEDAGSQPPIHLVAHKLLLFMFLHGHETQSLRGMAEGLSDAQSMHVTSARASPSPQHERPFCHRCGDAETERRSALGCHVLATAMAHGYATAARGEAAHVPILDVGAIDVPNRGTRQGRWRFVLELEVSKVFRPSASTAPAAPSLSGLVPAIVLYLCQFHAPHCIAKPLRPSLCTIASASSRRPCINHGQSPEDDYSKAKSPSPTQRLSPRRRHSAPAAAALVSPDSPPRYTGLTTFQVRLYTPRLHHAPPTSSLCSICLPCSSPIPRPRHQTLLHALGLQHDHQSLL